MVWMAWLLSACGVALALTGLHAFLTFYTLAIPLDFVGVIFMGLGLMFVAFPFSFDWDQTKIVRVA